MKKHLIVIAFILPFMFSCKSDVTKIVERMMFDKVDQWPEFPGGMWKFYSFLEKNIRYPAIAKQNHIQGKVFVTFKVEKNGELTNIHILRGLSPEIDAEAIRVLKLSPKWKPGIRNKQVVSCSYTVPIKFSLNSDTHL